MILSVAFKIYISHKPIILILMTFIGGIYVDWKMENVFFTNLRSAAWLSQDCGIVFAAITAASVLGHVYQLALHIWMLPC